MEILTVDEIKWQARLETTDTFEDNDLEELGGDAEQAIADLCQMSLDELMETYGNDLSLARPIKRAMLMTAAHMYKFRENTTPEAVNRVPGCAYDLVMPYVKLT